MESPLAITLGARSSAYLNTSEDYHKYRKRLNKQLQRLRHDLGLIVKDTKNYKSKEKQSTISNEDYDKNPKFGLLLLLTAERDLVYSLELRSLIEVNSEGNALSYSTLMISKLKKSIQVAKRLLTVVENEQDDFKLLELYIYCAILEGLLAVHKRRWERSLDAFSKVKCGLELLADKRDGQNEFNKAGINDVITTLVDPSLNLSISQLDFGLSDLKTVARKHSHDQTIPYLLKIVKLISKHDESYVKELSTSINLIKSISWREHEANLYNDEISFKLVSLTKPEVNDFKEIEQFDELLTGWTEVLELHQQDLQKHDDEDDSERIQDRAILLTFINYNLLFTKISRDLTLVDNLTKELDGTSLSKVKKLMINKDISRLYEAIVITLEEIIELPGVYNDDELLQSLELMIQFYNGQKSLRLSNSLMVVEKYVESLKVLSAITFSHNQYLVENFPFGVTNNQQLQKFKTELNNLLLNNQILAQFTVEATFNLEPFVIENTDKFPQNLKNIVNLGENAKLQPVLPKPVLFDIGFNYINYANGSESGSPEPQTDSDDKKKSGFFGIFGRS